MSIVTYQRDEIISSSELVRHLKKLLDELRTKKKQKIAISRHNKIEAIIITPEVLDEFLEHAEIYQVLKKNKSKSKKRAKLVSLEDLEREYGL